MVGARKWIGPSHGVDSGHVEPVGSNHRLAAPASLRKRGIVAQRVRARRALVLASVIGLLLGVAGQDQATAHAGTGGCDQRQVRRHGTNSADLLVSASAPGTRSPRKRFLPAQLSVGAIGDDIFSLTAAINAPTAELDLAFPIGPCEHFYGLGERFGRLDLTGQNLDNWAEDWAADPTKRASYSPTPFLLSSDGYGLLLDTPARAVFDIGATHAKQLQIHIAAPTLHAWVINGADPSAILKRRARLIGLPPLPPRWAFGVWKNLIGGDARIDADLAALRSNNVPIDAVWVYDAVDPASGFGWPWPIYAPIPRGSYSNLAATIANMHREGLKVLGYLNPFLYRGTAAFDEAQQRGYLLKRSDGAPIVHSWHDSATVDFTNPWAVAWWQARVRHALIDVGFDGAMQDFGDGSPTDAVYANRQPGPLVHNVYPVLYAQAAREAAQAAKPDDTVFFMRAGYSGSERYTTGGFTGDQTRTWDTRTGLASVLSGLLNNGMSGRPYVGPDIAGFVQRGTSPTQRELWTRWLELGALSPTLRDMLGDAQRPVDALTDHQTLALFATYARLHTAIEPYLYEQAIVAHQTGLPIIRPLFLDNPTPATYRIDDEYLLGPDLLVAPVTRPGQTHRRVYLPSGTWIDHWTKTVHNGPAWVSLRAPLNQIPLLVRCGSPSTGLSSVCP
jgi:alpha-D-xyloside xylohydrolase